MLLSDKKEMDRHKQYLSKYCRLCDKHDENLKYNIQTFAAELEFEYKVDISKDDANSQSTRCCRACYKSLQKVREKMLYLRKTPGSKKVFSYKLPAYSDNMKVHTTELGCPCLVGVEVEVEVVEAEVGGVQVGVGDVQVEVGDIQVEVSGNNRGAAAGYQIDDLQENVQAETPSKVRRISGDEPQESPVDKLTAREVKRKTPTRLHIKFEQTKRKILPGNIAVQDTKVKKIFTSNDSFSTSRVVDTSVAKIFFCRVCGQFPRVAKVSKMCLHIFCSVCIDNYKKEVQSSKCPPAHKDDENDDPCIIPSNADDIVNITSFIKAIHESIRICCKNEYCNKSFNVKEITNHEEHCAKRGFYVTEKKSLATSSSKPLFEETDEAIKNVVKWSEAHKVSPCDFLFFALKRLITREAPEMEESVKSVFKIFLKKADPDEKMTGLEGLAVKINADLSNSQYIKLRQNKKVGSQLPSLQKVIKEKIKLDPGNVNYKIFREDGEVVTHIGQPDSGIIDIDEDLSNFSYGDLNINVGGYRSSLHDTIAKLYEEKYPEIFEEILASPDRDAVLNDPNRKLTLYVKICFDGTSASVRSCKGANRLPVSNWFRGTVGLVGLDIVFTPQEEAGNRSTEEPTQGEPVVHDEQEVESGPGGSCLGLGAESGEEGIAAVAGLDLPNKNAEELIEIFEKIPAQVANMSLMEIVKSFTK